MEAGCEFRSIQLRVASVYIRVCGDEAEVRVSPAWDNIGRHEYVAFGTVEEVLSELKQLAEGIMKAVEVLENMAGKARNQSHSCVKQLFLLLFKQGV
jgi:hypothetical protein